MTRVTRLTTGALALVLGAMSLGACVAPAGPIEVNRFHVLDQKPGFQKLLAQHPLVAVVPGPGMDPESLEFRSFAGAVERELSRIGLSTIGEDKPALEVRVRFERATLSPLAQKSPVSVGVGGSTGSYGSGLGVGVGIDLSGPPKPVIKTRLFATMVDPASGEAIWEGRAENSVRQGSPVADTQLAAAKLAAALFTNFPGNSGETIEVP